MKEKETDIFRTKIKNENENKEENVMSKKFIMGALAALMLTTSLTTTSAQALTKNDNLRVAFENFFGYSNIYKNGPPYYTKTDDPCYYYILLNNYTKFTSQEGQEFLKTQAAGLFSDVNGDEWYAPYLAYSVFTGASSGYPDGTFKPNQPITRAEFYTILALSKGTVEDAQRVSGRVAGLNSNLGVSDSWYTIYYAVLTKSGGGADFSLPDLTSVTPEYLNKPITRGEAANIIGSLFYYTEVKAIYDKGVGGISSYGFPDIKGLTTYDYSTMIKPQGWTEGDGMLFPRTWYETQIETAKKNPSVAPIKLFCGMKVLKDKGIMKGDQNGNSNWSQGMTRAEALTLIQNQAVYAAKSENKK